MAISKKLETIYYNGQPDGIRSIRRHLSTMTTYVIPRPLLAEAKKISNTNRPGIYYLISENDNNKIAQLYVGQTRNGIIRLDDHNRSKDFWNKAIMFLADSKTFTLDMISGLEAYAINKATDAKRCRSTSRTKSRRWRSLLKRTFAAAISVSARAISISQRNRLKALSLSFSCCTRVASWFLRDAVIIPLAAIDG